RGSRVPRSACTASKRLVADAEGLSAPEGNTRPSGMARRGRSAGVLRPWHAGRETSKNLGGPRRSCRGKRRCMVYSSRGTEGETRTWNNAGTYALWENTGQAGGEVR